MCLSHRHVNVSPLQKNEWYLSFFFSPHRLPDHHKRAFHIGKFGIPIEIRLYHHFKLNRHKNTSPTWQFSGCCQEIDANQLKTCIYSYPGKVFLSITMYGFFPADLNKGKIRNVLVIYSCLHLYLYKSKS